MLYKEDINGFVLAMTPVMQCLPYFCQQNNRAIMLFSYLNRMEMLMSNVKFKLMLSAVITRLVKEQRIDFTLNIIIEL
jgi:hypothetical protein